MPSRKHEDASNNRQEGDTRAGACCIYFRAWMSRGRACHSDVSLAGKTAIITGGNAGIGKETVRDLARRGCSVIMACRNIEKAEEAASEIKREVPDAKLAVWSLDLASQSSVRQFAHKVLEEVEAIHLLINNAGIAACPRTLTEDGVEMQLGVNHLGHFLLTHLLMERLKRSAPARVVTVASIAHYLGKIDFKDLNFEHGYRPILAYCRSKLANILFTRSLARRLEGSGVTAYCLHPGIVHTGLGRHVGTSMTAVMGVLYSWTSRLFFMNAKKGAQTTIYCAVEESIKDQSGLYYSDCRVTQPTSKAMDDEVAEKLWKVSEQMVGITT